MRERKTPQRTSAEKRQPAAASEAKDKAAALARARCTEIAMLAAAKGWGKKRSAGT